jgi:hypothetical protein
MAPRIITLAPVTKLGALALLGAVSVVACSRTPGGGSMADVEADEDATVEAGPAAEAGAEACAATGDGADGASCQASASQCDDACYMRDQACRAACHMAGCNGTCTGEFNICHGQCRAACLACACQCDDACSSSPAECPL